MTSLPTARGPLTATLFARLTARTHERLPVHVSPHVLGDDDAQLALHCIHELSYRGFDQVDPAAEEDPWIIDLRLRLHAAMEAELRAGVGPCPVDATAELLQLAAPDQDPGSRSLSGFIERTGSLEQVRELANHRSAYQLKEADPHSWGIPRVGGRAKAALMRIQFDEYGAGVPGESHAELFAATMSELGLEARYGAHVDRLPAQTLATGNLISLFGSSRRLLPALIGHLALFEMCSVGPMARYSRALERLGVGARGRRFYDVHVVADAEHEVIALRDLVGGLLESEPASGPEISFGARALALVEGRFSTMVLDAFSAGRTSLLAVPPAAQLRRAS